jgi:hypothetical protein
MFMQDLLDDAGEFLEDVLLQDCGEAFPDGGGSVRHGASHSWTSKRSWRIDSRVNFVEHVGRRQGARLVAARGMRSRICSR